MDEALIGSFGDFDLRKMYDEFNNRYFDGRLPDDITLRFSAKLKKATGRAGAKMKGPIRGGGKRKKVRQLELEVFDYEIAMSKLVKFSDSDFVPFFLHEMIHIYFFSQGWPWESHGDRFQRMARKIGRAAGVEIPLTHSLRGDEKVDAEPKTIGVLTVSSTSGEDLFLFFRTRHMELWIDVAGQIARQNPERTVVIFQATTRAWALAPVRQKPTRRTISLMKRLKPVVKAHLDFNRASVIWSSANQRGESLIKRPRRRR